MKVSKELKKTLSTMETYEQMVYVREVKGKSIESLKQAINDNAPEVVIVIHCKGVVYWEKLEYELHNKWLSENE
jgi:hypothetical protein